MRIGPQRRSEVSALLTPRNVARGVGLFEGSTCQSLAGTLTALS